MDDFIPVQFGPDGQAYLEELPSGLDTSSGSRYYQNGFPTVEEAFTAARNRALTQQAQVELNGVVGQGPYTVARDGTRVLKEGATALTTPVGTIYGPPAGGYGGGGGTDGSGGLSPLALGAIALGALFLFGGKR